MMKSWLIQTSAPFVGTDQYYAAYSEENPLESEKLSEWFWDIETMEFWDNYGYTWENEFEDEFEESKEEYDNNFDIFYDYKIQEWKEECSISCRECDEEEFHMYVPGGEGELEIIYDEREK